MALRLSSCRNIGQARIPLKTISIRTFRALQYLTYTECTVRVCTVRTVHVLYVRTGQGE